MNIPILLSVIVLASVFGGIQIVPAYAFPGFDSWNFFSDFKRVSQTFVESITIDPVQRQQIIVKNMAQWQAEKDELISQNKPVPKQYDDIISAKKESIKKMDTESSNALSSVIDTVLVGNEMGKINSFVKRFHELREHPGVDDGQKITELEKEVNQLNLVKKHCKPISVNVLISVKEPYDSIVDSCSVLKDIPKPVVMASLGE